MVVVEDVEWSEEGVEVCGCVGLGRSTFLFSLYFSAQRLVRACVCLCACPQRPTYPNGVRPRGPRAGPVPDGGELNAREGEERAFFFCVCVWPPLGQVVAVLRGARRVACATSVHGSIARLLARRLERYAMTSRRVQPAKSPPLIQGRRVWRRRLRQGGVLPLVPANAPRSGARFLSPAPPGRSSGNALPDQAVGLRQVALTWPRREP
jgi:hypothetical protein